MIRWTARVLATVCLIVSAALAAQSDTAVDIEALLTQGDQAWQLGEMQEAEEALLRAIKAAPDSPAPLIRLGGLQLSQQHYSESLRSYQAVLSLDPDDQTLGRAYLGMGLAYLHTGDRELAREAFMQASEHVTEERRTDVERILEYLGSQASADVPAGAHP
jgi:tetratricopeptide (TPR) repeat protein